jgi:hypothetical protein
MGQTPQPWYHKHETRKKSDAAGWRGTLAQLAEELLTL